MPPERLGLPLIVELQRCRALMMQTEWRTRKPVRSWLRTEARRLTVR
jgi:hypothetical protein